VTILYSFYASDGIVFAADRMLTRREQGKPAAYVESRLPKVIRIPKVGVHDDGGLIGYFGHAEVAGRTTSFLRRVAEKHSNAGGSIRVEPFARTLIESLPRGVRDGSVQEVLGFHIGAFEKFGRYRLPVFWFVRNCELIPPGVYVARGGWKMEEQFLGRDMKTVQSGDVRANLRRFQNANSVPFWYRNGDLPSFTPVTDAVKAAIAVTASLPGYGPPDGFDAWCDLARTFVYTSRNLARLTYRGGQVSIGGKADVEGLPWP